MRTIAVITVGRSDYGIYLSILRRIKADPALRLHLVVSGTHLAPQFGFTAQTIEADGFEIGDRVELPLAGDGPQVVATAMGIATIGYAKAFARTKPDIVVVLGDRFEMHPAAVAALPFKIPVAHIHGGELTEGAIDDSLRHSLTKLSHLHFVATEEYAERVRQMGEEPWRVMVTGAPGLDNLNSVVLRDLEQLASKYQLRLNELPLLVTFHATTLEYEAAGSQAEELLSALAQVAPPIVFTLPNADTGGSVITKLINEFVRTHQNAFLVENLGTQDYFSFMNVAAAMVGNSSSGLIEAPTFKLPVVNIGTRQDGRVRAANVIDVGYKSDEILQGIKRAMQPDFRTQLQQLENPYGSGDAAAQIVETLKTIPLGDRLTRKRFRDGEKFDE